jgi:hypothetical protein
MVDGVVPPLPFPELDTRWVNYEKLHGNPQYGGDFLRPRTKANFFWKPCRHGAHRLAVYVGEIPEFPQNPDAALRYSDLLLALPERRLHQVSVTGFPNTARKTDFSLMSSHQLGTSG